MTIEERIDKLVSKYEQWSLTDIHNWNWYGTPDSLMEVEERSCTCANCMRDYLFSCEVDKLIKCSDETECLTSQSHYIRECKRYFMESWLYFANSVLCPSTNYALKSKCRNIRFKCFRNLCNYDVIFIVAYGSFKRKTFRIRFSFFYNCFVLFLFEYCPKREQVRNLFTYLT